MKAHEIFQAISTESGTEILEFLREEDRDTFRGTLGSLANQRRLRPIFVQKKSRAEQAAWMLKSLRLKQCDGICELLLQSWLMKGYQDVLVNFLDGIGVKHNGKGEVEEELPEEIDAATLKSTVEGLLGEYDHQLISIYLHTFNLQSADGWESITALLASEPRLRLGALEAAPAPAVEIADEDSEGAGAEMATEEEDSGEER